MSQRILSIAAGASFGLAVALRSAARIPIFTEASEAAEPWVLTTIPSLAWVAAMIALGGAIGSFLPRRARTPCFFGAAAAAAAFIPNVFDVAPFVAAFSGRFLDFILMGCALVTVSRIWNLGTLPRGATAKRVSAVAACVFLAVGFKMSSDVGLSGDEPHYLLIAHSILHDGDLRVQNNYLDEDYQAFYRGKIGPHLARGTPYSIHGIGLPILLVPGYALWGLRGVLVTLALMGALVVYGLCRVSERLGMSAEATVLAVTAFALTSPALFLSVSAYPELPAAAVVMLVASHLASPATGSTRTAFSFAALVGTLPFFHMKFSVLALVLWLGLGWRHRGHHRVRDLRVATFAGVCLGAAALATYFYVTTGSVDPTASYGRQRIFLGEIPVGLLGLFFDQEFGLLIYAPVYLAGLAGWIALVRREPFFGVGAFLVLASVGLVGAAHPLWSGGNSVPARFLFPALPLLALGVGALWSWERKVGISAWIPSLLVVSSCVSVFTVILPGQPLYLNARDGTGQLWEALSSSWDLTSYLPSIVRLDPRSLVWALIALGIVVICLGLQYRRRTARLPAFALVLCVAAWAQDLSGVAHRRDHEGRWVSGFMRHLAERHSSRFLAVPSFETLETAEVLERVSLRLRPLRRDGDPRYWWSLPYSIPAGQYRVSGIQPEGWSPCNEFNCFEVDDVRFRSEVALARFRVRAKRLQNPPPRLHFESVVGSRPLAIRSLAVSGQRRLHSLDDEAYLDRRGFWVKRAARASFALETEGELRLTNGGRDNTVVIHTATGTERLELAPRARTAFSVPAGEGVSVFSIESRGGFRPSELDADASDHRDLGVLVGAPRF